MGYDDRMNNEFAATIRGDMKEAHDQVIAKVGLPMSAQQESKLAETLVKDFWQKPEDAKDMAHATNVLMSEDGAKPLQVFKEALEGRVPRAFLKNDANFTEVNTLLTGAVTDFKQRVADIGNETTASAPTASAHVAKPPTQGR